MWLWHLRKFLCVLHGNHFVEEFFDIALRVVTLCMWLSYLLSNNIFPYFLACSVVVLFIFILRRIPLGWFGVVYTFQLVLCKILFIRSWGGKFVAITNKYAFQKMFNSPSSWSDPLLWCYCCGCAELYPHKTGRLQLYLTIPMSPHMYSTQATNLNTTVMVYDCVIGVGASPAPVLAGALFLWFNMDKFKIVCTICRRLLQPDCFKLPSYAPVCCVNRYFSWFL